MPISYICSAHYCQQFGPRVENQWFQLRRSIGLRTRSRLDESDLAVLSQMRQCTHKRLHSDMALKIVYHRLKTISRTTFALVDPMDHSAVGAESLIRVLHLGFHQRSWKETLFRLSAQYSYKQLGSSAL
jgi:hypothetical protein